MRTSFTAAIDKYCSLCLCLIHKYYSIQQIYLLNKYYKFKN